MRLTFYIILGTLILTSAGCGSKDVSESKDQGIIEYDITYIENNLKNVSASFLPKSMVLKFNDKYAMNNIEGFMGFISIKLITDISKRKTTTMLKFIDNKYVFHGDRDEAPCCYDMGTLKIEELEDTLQIAGTHCKKVKAYDEMNNTDFTMYFTSEVNLDKPYRNTPYENIDGVLMEFRMNLEGLSMNLKARSVKFCEVGNEEFSVPDEYKVISRLKMAEIIAKILE